MVNFYPFLAYVFVTTFTPGPNNVLSMSNAVQSGYKKTLPFLGGISSGFFIVMLLCGVLNFALVNLIPQVHAWLNWLGAAYMLYLAIHIALSKPAADDTAPRSLSTYWAGFNLQFLNLKLILYGVTVFSNFIIQAYSDPLSLGLFSVGLTVVGFAATSCWALGGDIFRSFLKKYERPFNYVMAALLVYTAVASLLH